MIARDNSGIQLIPRVCQFSHFLLSMVTKVYALAKRYGFS